MNELVKFYRVLLNGCWEWEGSNQFSPLFFTALYAVKVLNIKTANRCCTYLLHSLGCIRWWICLSVRFG